jgi:hypothetical protein
MLKPDRPYTFCRTHIEPLIFYDAVSISDYIGSKSEMTGEKNDWKEAGTTPEFAWRQ